MMDNSSGEGQWPTPPPTSHKCLNGEVPRSNKGFGFGSISILNSPMTRYTKFTLPGTEESFVTVLNPQTFPSYKDIHENQTINEGAVLVTAVNVTQVDLSAIGGPKDGWVQDGLFYEIDIKTNETLFRWITVEYLPETPLLGKGTSKTSPYEYPHLDAVAKYGDSYLIFFRFLCSIFLMHQHGNVTWHLHCQKGTDSTLSPGTTFCYQHNPQIQSHAEERMTLHLHNNENAEITSQTTKTTGMTLGPCGARLRRVLG
ncbi:hypothetical protein ETB97_004224 [Aspergillus alliaceus]|uniref:ASST-domain-containing protein n=1 Tax=Petromyces alliaceus TaxID=209559 RepID=A0A8H6ABB5_PETAA|nr:hypothetical protein ETB97_004224 [Aspergillus burnettii]